ncbi:glycosyltransferase family 4 protein [Pontibacter locisalis]|uniref:Glycosyltransferase family 4 protein n=1 Tax=Pontibacter locisalis TaxID=1719035 RepID=A0ABW5IL05_9BACT
MKLIVIGTRGFPYIQGGIETHCQGLYPELVKLGCDVTVVRRTAYINASNKIKKFHGVKFKDIWTPKLKSLEAIVHTFLALIYCSIKRPDIVHFHGIGPSIFVPLARILGLRVVVTTQGPDYDRQKWGTFAKFVLKLGEKLGTKYSNEVIVVSDVIEKLTQDKYNRFNSNLIFNGVNFPNKSENTEYIKSLGLTKNGYIIAVARFVEEKGFHYLIDAYIALKNKDYKLVLVGDADHETNYSLELKKKARENGIVLTGFIKGEQLNEIFSHARLFILPSFHEGLSLALLEALSYDLDVLVSDIPANTSAPLAKDSFFPVGNVKELTRRLSYKLKEPVFSDKYDLNEYQWDIIAKKTYKVYTKALPARKSKQIQVGQEKVTYVEIQQPHKTSNRISRNSESSNPPKTASVL